MESILSIQFAVLKKNKVAQKPLSTVVENFNPLTEEVLSFFNIQLFPNPYLSYLEINLPYSSMITVIEDIEP